MCGEGSCFDPGIQNADLNKGRDWQQDTTFKDIPMDALSTRLPLSSFYHLSFDCLKAYQWINPLV